MLRIGLASVIGWIGDSCPLQRRNICIDLLIKSNQIRREILRSPRMWLERTLSDCAFLVHCLKAVGDQSHQDTPTTPGSWGQ